jgi:hypothetical protein
MTARPVTSSRPTPPDSHRRPVKLSDFQSRITCPHCWEPFKPEDILWVSEHADLLGDPRLGADFQQRFLPTRFSVAGDALDAKGFPCRTLACPRCHLAIPRPVLELPPLFLSIIGSPGSGKSFLLASMTWQLRQVLTPEFCVSFSDADPSLNRSLNDYEESLFLNARAEELQPLAGLIRKTEEQGELYDTVSFGNQTISYPRPFLFSVQPQAGHPNESRSERIGRLVCLYDNAGESFQPGKDDVSSPVTRHMAHSSALYFVFDPTQDSRFRSQISAAAQAALANQPSRATRQEQVLQEAAARIRRYARLIVVVTKYDAWSHLLEDLVGENSRQEPWRPVNSTAGGVMNSLDLPRIEHYSQRLRLLMQKFCPDIVAAAESFAKEVIYMPASAVGWATKFDQRTGLMAIRPSQTRPFWVTVPFLYALCRWSPGLIPGIRRKEGSA